MKKNRRTNPRTRKTLRKRKAEPGGAREPRTGLARALSKLGHCSRSEAARLIRAGQVRLNDRIPRDPETPVRLGRDRIRIADLAVGAARKIYLALNKPRGIVTTAADEKGRDTVYSLLPGGLPWLAPVGRLDMASEGLLLLTNDSRWAAAILDPRTRLGKTYHVHISGLPDETLVRDLAAGVATPEGEILRATSVRVLRSGSRNSWLEMILEEGKNRQIRRMLEVLGTEVLDLVRVAIGPVALGDLPKGRTRELSAEEKRALDLAIASPREARTA